MRVVFGYSLSRLQRQWTIWTDWLFALALKRRSGTAAYIITSTIFVVSVFFRFLLARWLQGPSFFVFFPGLVLGTIFAGLVAGVALLAGFGFVVFYAIMPPLSSRTVPGDSNSPRTFSLASSSCLYSGGSSN